MHGRPDPHSVQIAPRGFALALALLVLLLLSVLGLALWTLTRRAGSEAAAIVHYNQAYYLAEGAVAMALEQYDRTGSRGDSFSPDAANIVPVDWSTPGIVAASCAIGSARATVKVRIEGAAPPPPPPPPTPTSIPGGDCCCAYRVKDSAIGSTAPPKTVVYRPGDDGKCPSIEFVTRDQGGSVQVTRSGMAKCSDTRLPCLQQ
jgi:hypothetical protein